MLLALVGPVCQYELNMRCSLTHDGSPLPAWKYTWQKKEKETQAGMVLPHIPYQDGVENSIAYFTAPPLHPPSLLPSLLRQQRAFPGWRRSAVLLSLLLNSTLSASESRLRRPGSEALRQGAGLISSQQGQHAPAYIRRPTPIPIPSRGCGSDWQGLGDWIFLDSGV